MAESALPSTSDLAINLVALVDLKAIPPSVSAAMAALLNVVFSAMPQPPRAIMAVALVKPVPLEDLVAVEVALAALVVVNQALVGVVAMVVPTLKLP